MTLIKKGAEADLMLEDFAELLHPMGEGKVLVKHRIQKEYRIEGLDRSLRDSRTALEAKLLSDAKRAGVPTPVVYEVDRVGMRIVMEYKEGQLVKTILDGMDSGDRRELCELIGKQIARLHGAGIIHGDLTTSNMIRALDGKVYFIDFGLGRYEVSLEARGTDLHLLSRTLQSTHFDVSEEAFDAILDGYRREFGEGAEEVIERAQEIDLRGRYSLKEDRSLA